MVCVLFYNVPESLKLILFIGSGPQDLPTGLFALVSAKQPPFEPGKKVGKLWYQIYSKPFLQKASYECTSEEVTQEITKRWERFVQSDLPQIEEAVRAEAWIWKQPG